MQLDLIVLGCTSFFAYCMLAGTSDAFSNRPAPMLIANYTNRNDPEAKVDCDDPGRKTTTLPPISLPASPPPTSNTQHRRPAHQPPNTRPPLLAIPFQPLLHACPTPFQTL